MIIASIDISADTTSSNLWLKKKSLFFARRISSYGNTFVLNSEITMPGFMRCMKLRAES